MLFVDVENRVIKDFSDKGVKIYEFDELEELVANIKSRRVMYITEIIDVSLTDFIKTIQGLIKEIDQEDDSDQPYFLQCTKKGSVIIQDIGLTFEGPADVKLIDEELHENLKNSVAARKLLKDKVLRIINYRTMQKSVKKESKAKAEYMSKRQSAKDAQLDDITIKDGAVGSSIALAEKMFDGDDGLVNLQFTGEDIKAIEREQGGGNEMSDEELAEALRTGRAEL